MIRRSRTWLVLAASAVLLVGGGACGDDPPPPAPQKKAAKKTSRGKGAKAGKGGGDDVAVASYLKIEDIVPADEVDSIRKPLGPRDFETDPSGNINRDPFRSYVVNQPGVANQTDPALSKPTEYCDTDNMRAPNYWLRDLRLVGIVLRGTRSYALFRDSSSFGHIVRKGDCLGKEKARVASIETGFVNLELIPETAPGQPAKPPQERAIQLYPEELQLEEPEQPPAAEGESAGT